MKKEILNNGLDQTIERKQTTINNLVFMLFVLTLTTFAAVILLVHRTKVNDALEYQVSQRDSIIQQYKYQEMQLINYNIKLSKYDEVK